MENSSLKIIFIIYKIKVPSSRSIYAEIFRVLFNLNVSDVSSNQVSLRIQEDWNDDYARESSPAYTDLKNRTETQVSKGNIVRFFPRRHRA